MWTALRDYASTHDLPDTVQREITQLVAAAERGPASTDTHPDGWTPVDLDTGKLPELPEDLDGAEPEAVGFRYDDFGPLGSGGMGTVRRVRDMQLGRVLAMKILRFEAMRSGNRRARFLEEAQVTAQLQHPNILPIHDLGFLPDGRLWYTMKEVRGRTLDAVLDEVHDASPDRWAPSDTGWTLRRLVTAFRAVCDAVAYAHERGVVHRDLKPDNVMVGDRGELYVLDWGLAKVVGRKDLAAETGELDLVRTARADDRPLTRLGQIAGTPAYMPPEQARGDIGHIDARSDVYALGAILYEILAGAPPYGGAPDEVIVQVLAGPPVPIGGDDDHDDLVGPPLPQALVEACRKAMAREPDDRYQTATELSRAVEAWLDGSARRAQALEVVAAALETDRTARGLQRRARELQVRGDAALAALEAWRPDEDKARAWALQDRASRLRRESDRKQLESDLALHGALRIDPTLPEAHAALAERYLRRHADAEDARDADEAARGEQRLRHHSRALPETHPTRERCAAWLRGDGALTLVTDPPGARVQLFRFDTRLRRLAQVPLGELGTTPLRAAILPMGRYLCVLSHPEHDDVRYPVEIRRQAHWDGVAPGDAQATPIGMPPRGFLDPREVYVPAGWFQAGGDWSAPMGQRARRLWCDALVIDRFPVTNRQYLEFLDDLVARGRLEEALRHAPRERAGAADQGPLIYGFDGERFSLQADADGDVWTPELPVLQVDWFGARAFLAWEAARTGRPWRLPMELEWEKAARGVDGRSYPWGDHHDPSWCCMGSSHRGRPLPAVVDSFPVDESVYGVRGMGGNVRDWCLDRFSAPEVRGRLPAPTPDGTDDIETLRVLRGGLWTGGEHSARCAGRNRVGALFRVADLGFRGAYRPQPHARPPEP